MLVPAVDAVRRSPATATGPECTDTVANMRLRLSGSLIVIPGASATAPPSSVYEAVEGTFERAGGSLTAMICTVVVCGAELLLDAWPSSTVQVIVRVALAPKFVGLSIEFANATDSST